MQLQEARLLAAAARHREQPGQVLALHPLDAPHLDVEPGDRAAEFLGLGREITRRRHGGGLVHEVAHAHDVGDDRVDGGERGASRRRGGDRITEQQQALDAAPLVSFRLVTVEAIAREQERLGDGRDDGGVGGGRAEMDRDAAGTLSVGFPPGAGAEATPAVAVRRMAPEPHEGDGPGATRVMDENVLRPAAEVRGRNPLAEWPREGTVDARERGRLLALRHRKHEQIRRR